MSSPLPEKKPKKTIHEFFRPYLKNTSSTVPAKRASPSLEESEQAERLPRDVSTIATPKAKEKRKISQQNTRTPGSSSYSPVSVRGSASLSIRSKTSHAKTPIPPPTTYKRASIFSSPQVVTPKPPQAKSFSFANLPSSTQAVFKNGEVIGVRDSDDDTDSLESLEDLFDRRKGGHTTSLSSTPGDDEATLEAERVRTLSLFTSGYRKQAPVVGKDRIRELRAKEKAFTFDIANLLDDHFEDQEVQNKVKKARADVEAARKAAEADTNQKLDKKLLAAVAITDEGEHDIARLMDAVDRTEALTSEDVFLFFGVDGLNDWHDGEPFEYPFPEDTIPNLLWREGDDESRSRAYISGYMSDLATSHVVSDEALNWTFRNVVLERSDELRQAYIDCLRSASSSWTRTSITAQEVQTVFQTLGADSNSLRDSVEIKPRHRLLKEPPRRDPRYLLAALDLFQAISWDMDFVALSKLTSMLCRLAVDAELMSDGQISAKVEGLLEHLLSLPEIVMRTHIAERMLADVGKYLKNPTLQAHLLSHILPTTPLACKVRILLAEVFLLGISTLKKWTYLTPKISLDKLTNHISASPDFDTKRRKGVSTMDYLVLRARTHILDVAISDGGRPSTFVSRAEENTFNKSVDCLADMIKTIEVAIADPGASHMTRTVAKDDLRALHARLLFSVRTEVRPKRHIFDSKMSREVEEVRETERGKGFMDRFLGKKKEKEVRREGDQKMVKNKKGGEEEKSRPVSREESSLVSVASSERSETEKAIRRQLDLSP